MDHLPQVLGRKGSLTRVPYVCDAMCFDGLEFESFPVRKGFNLVMQHEWPKFILHADGSRLSQGLLAEIAQAWLFFGLLIEVLKVSDIHVTAEDFIQVEGCDRFIDTRSLPNYLSEWERKELLLPEKSRKTHFRRQQQMIMISNQFRLHQISGQWWQDSLLQWVERPKESYIIALPLELQMSLTILCDTLDRASRRARGILKSDSSEPMLQNQFLINEFRARSWCPSEIAFVLQNLDDSSSCFVSQLDRRRLDVNHSNCSDNKCLAFSVVTEHYRTKHTSDCLGCEDVSIDDQELASTLQRRQIPRACLRMSEPASTLPIGLHVVESGPYIAISHVWSDGLGNPKANSLPTCQLLRLYKMAIGLDVEFFGGNPSLWIDSLLVPVGKGAEKKIALSSLCEYYRAAEKVLVLDSDLMQASRACTEEELLARVLYSTWMRRLWTLEEGILSYKNLVFQFRDGIVNLSDLTHSERFLARVSTVGNVLYESLRLSLPDLTNYPRSSSEKDLLQSQIFTKLLPALEYRSTTKAADEPLCIAHILELDASRLVIIDDAELRMREFIQMLAERGCTFPRGLLFTKEPKLQLDGFRWCPTSLMAFEREDIECLMREASKKYAKLLDKGLLIQGISGFAFLFEKEIFKKLMYVEVDKRIYALTPVPVGQSCRDGTYWTADSSTEALSIDATKWSAEMQSMLGTSPKTTAVLFDGSNAILVSINSIEGQKSDPDGTLIHARPLGQLYMRVLKTSSKNHFAAGAESEAIAFGQLPGYLEEVEKEMRQSLQRVYDPETSTSLNCNLIDPSQRWCIG
ncbi:hypothetical protein ACLMJK_004219 [Lecanora helva]